MDTQLANEFNRTLVENYLNEKAKITEQALHRYIGEIQCHTPKLIDAMKYSLLAGGKRLRPTLVLASSELFHGDEKRALPCACAIEMIHTYSLIHDDLPALDNDDFRRGKPTLHRVYGEAIALLAGDALLTLAFELLGKTGVPEVVVEVARSAGINGMVGGQTLDIESEGKMISIDELRTIHKKKTGALICASLRCGAILANASSQQLNLITDYGEHIGIAFQIVDDILNVEGDFATLGKPIGSDEKLKKATYPAILGMDKAKSLAVEHTRQAIEIARQLDQDSTILQQIALYILFRKK